MTRPVQHAQRDQRVHPLPHAKIGRVVGIAAEGRRSQRTGVRDSAALVKWMVNAFRDGVRLETKVRANAASAELKRLRGENARLRARLQAAGLAVE